MEQQTLIHRRVEEARAGTHPGLICRVPSGWVVMADQPLLHGHCLLLPDPVVAGLNDLPAQERGAFLYDMSVVGDVLLELTGAYRINYAIFCNQQPALHAHICPRYLSEPEALRLDTPWVYQNRPAEPMDPEARRAFRQKVAVSLGQKLL